MHVDPETIRPYIKHSCFEPKSLGDSFGKFRLHEDNIVGPVAEIIESLFAHPPPSAADGFLLIFIVEEKRESMTPYVPAFADAEELSSRREMFRHNAPIRFRAIV